MKKKTLLIAALMLTSLGMKAEEGVILLLKNGQKVGFVFSEKPTVKTGTTLEIKTTKEEVAYEYSEVKNIQFGDISTDGISKTKNDARQGGVYRLTAEGLAAEGLAEGETVSVYGVDGKLVGEAKAVNGTASLALPAAKGSVYVVRTSKGTAFKFNKKQ